MRRPKQNFWNPQPEEESSVDDSSQLDKSTAHKRLWDVIGAANRPTSGSAEKAPGTSAGVDPKALSSDIGSASTAFSNGLSKHGIPHEWKTRCFHLLSHMSRGGGSQTKDISTKLQNNRAKMDFELAIVNAFTSKKFIESELYRLADIYSEEPTKDSLVEAPPGTSNNAHSGSCSHDRHTQQTHASVEVVNSERGSFDISVHSTGSLPRLGSSLRHYNGRPSPMEVSSETRLSKSSFDIFKGASSDCSVDNEPPESPFPVYGFSDLPVAVSSDTSLFGSPLNDTRKNDDEPRKMIKRMDWVLAQENIKSEIVHRSVRTKRHTKGNNRLYEANKGDGLPHASAEREPLTDEKEVGDNEKQRHGLIMKTQDLNYEFKLNEPSRSVLMASKAQVSGINEPSSMVNASASHNDELSASLASKMGDTIDSPPASKKRPASSFRSSQLAKKARVAPGRSRHPPSCPSSSSSSSHYEASEYESQLIKTRDRIKQLTEHLNDDIPRVQKMCAEFLAKKAQFINSKATNLFPRDQSADMSVRMLSQNRECIPHSLEHSPNSAFHNYATQSPGYRHITSPGINNCYNYPQFNWGGYWNQAFPYQPSFVNTLPIHYHPSLHQIDTPGTLTNSCYNAPQNDCGGNPNQARSYQPGCGSILDQHHHRDQLQLTMRNLGSTHELPIHNYTRYPSWINPVREAETGGQDAIMNHPDTNHLAEESGAPELREWSTYADTGLERNSGFESVLSPSAVELPPMGRYESHNKLTNEESSFNLETPKSPQQTDNDPGTKEGSSAKNEIPVSLGGTGIGPPSSTSPELTEPPPQEWSQCVISENSLLDEPSEHTYDAEFADYGRNSHCDECEIDQSQISEILGDTGFNAKSVLLRPLPLMKSAEDAVAIRSELKDILARDGLVCKNMVIYHGPTMGVPIHYACVEFFELETALAWQDMHKGFVYLTERHGKGGERKASMRLSPNTQSWDCQFCKTPNFAQRVHCHNCFKHKLSGRAAIDVSLAPTRYLGIKTFQPAEAIPESIICRHFKSCWGNYFIEATGLPLGLCVFDSGTPKEANIWLTALRKKGRDAIFVNHEIVVRLTPIVV